MLYNISSAPGFGIIHEIRLLSLVESVHIQGLECISSDASISELVMYLIH
jgi:hypothetical protein